MSYRLNIFADAQGAAAACASFIASSLHRELAENPWATLAVSGGSTPRLMFDALVHEPLDWSRVHLFFVDERPVPPGDPQSNYTLCETRLLTPAKVPAASVHRILAERGPAVAAARYSDEIASFFGQNAVDAEGKSRQAPDAGALTPRFTVIQCGIGPDCHTASLFPRQPLIDDREGLVAAVEVAKLQQTRITMLPRLLLDAKALVVLASGADKAWACEQACQAPYDPLQFPAQLLTRQRESELFLDQAAAAALR